MATRQAAAQAAEPETSEREYQATLNAAVAATEDEVFTDALGGEELENDGDTSLEDMGDGLEGEVEEDDAEEDGEQGEEEPEAEGEEGEDADTAQGDTAEIDGDYERPFREDARSQQRQDDRRIPPGRLREEADARRAAEARVIAMERTIAEYNGRIQELSARVNAPPQRQQPVEAPPKPDMFTDPAAYETWVLAEADRKAEAKIQQHLGQFQEQQKQRELQRVDRSLEAAARGPRAFEFSAAYNAMTSLDPRDRASQAVVNGVLQSSDPAKALFDWWDENGGPDYRDQVLNQLLPENQRPGNQQRGQQRIAGRQVQPRHVIRPAQSLPSLNAATGSNSQRTSDPDMLDGSDRSVFDYGTRR